MEKYDFSGWVTRANLRCSDGRTIMKDTFKHCDGKVVPLVWNHRHNDPNNILGNVVLQHRDEGIYGFGTFNDTESGQHAKALVEHGDIVSLSIYANQLKQRRNNNGGADVVHGMIREVSLVLAGANPGAFIDSVIRHSDDGDDEGFDIYTGLEIELYHADDNEDKKEEKDEMADENKKVEKPEDEETVQDVIDSMNEKQKTVMYALVGEALNASKGEDDDAEDGPDAKHNEEDDNMKKNAFDKEDVMKSTTLSHSDEEAIIELAKNRSVGTLQNALALYAEDHDELAHGFEDYEELFPDYKDVKPGAPELLERDYGWVSVVLRKAHKSPISRIRTRQADARAAEITAKGYKKGNRKSEIGKIKLLNRTTDPQTVYVKDSMHRDDIIDITDFDVVSYLRGVMRRALDEKIAICAMLGDGLEEGDEGKVDETHIRPIWTDDDLYAIHAEVDLAKAKEELQGTETGLHFGDNYVYAEAIIQAALYSRETYKGSGSLDFFCTPHLLNVMLLARDMNGRRIYSSKADLAAALNVNEIHTAEQFEGKVRTLEDGSQKRLLGIFVNMADYQFGATKGGQVTTFNQFDIDFNLEKALMEARLSGALIRPYSAIVLEEPVAAN